MSRLVSVGSSLLLGAFGAALAVIVGCEIEAVPPEAAKPPTDSGKYDCAKFAGYKKLCPNDPTPSQTPKSVCEEVASHPKCGDLGAKVMECLWGLQTRKDLCGADNVTIAGKVTDACGAADANATDCRARNP